MNYQLIQGDCLQTLKTLPANSVQTCVTSPPYYGLRDYQTATWEGGSAECDHVASRGGHLADSVASTRGGAHKVADAQTLLYRDLCGKCGARRIDQQIGLEDSPEAYVAKLVDVFREVRRVLRSDGTLWLNLGDSFQDKQLLGIPWKVAFALQADGWVLRMDIIWAKKNCMPESCRDRPTKSHEYIFLLSKGKWVGRESGRFAHISEQDARWLALFLDTEGNISVKRAQRPSGNTWYGAQMCFASTHRGLVDAAQAIIGQGTVLERDGKNAPMFYYQLSNQAASDLLRRLYPYLIVKKRQARLCIHLQDCLNTNGKKRPGGFRDPQWNDLLERMWLSNKSLNHFGNPDISWIPEPKEGYWTSQSYFYDAEAIKEPNAGDLPYGDKRNFKMNHEGAQGRHGKGSMFAGGTRQEYIEKYYTNGRNRRSVWTVTTKPYSGAHFAVFPPDLIEPCILAGTSAHGACAKCGAPWARVAEKDGQYQAHWAPGKQSLVREGIHGGTGVLGSGMVNIYKTTGWQPTCACDCTDVVPCTVLDPFNGSGTTGAVALKHNRRYIGLELNPAYIELAHDRIRKSQPMLLEAL